LKAFVVLAESAKASETLADELQAHVKQAIAPYKYPREIEFLEALPRTATGKLRRSELRGRYYSNSTIT
jgi:acyl-coenzyme A synthetase/AMP-(fatty) acid ligase